MNIDRLQVLPVIDSKVTTVANTQRINRQCSIKVTEINTLEGFNFYFYCSDLQDQQQLKMDWIYEFDFNIPFKEENTHTLKFGLYQQTKNKNKGDLVNKISFKTSHYLGLGDYEENIDFSNEKGKNFVIVNIKFIDKNSVVQKAIFQPFNTKEKQQSYLTFMLQEKLNFQLTPNSKMCVFQTTSFKKSILQLLEIIFPGMREDYDNDEEHIQTLTMYEEMLQTITKNFYSKPQTQQDIQKIKELVDSLFLLQQNDLLQKQIVIVPIKSSNIQQRLVIQSLKQQQQKNQDNQFIPIIYESIEELQLLEKVFVLLGLIYNFFKVFTINLRSKSVTKQEINSLQAYLQENDANKELDLITFNNLQYQRSINQLYDELSISEYLIQNSYTTQSFIKLMLFVSDNDVEKNQVYSIVNNYNQKVRVDSLQQVLPSTATSSIKSENVLNQSINLLTYVSQISSVAPTTIPPVVIYPIPLISSSLEQVIKEYSLNKVEIHKYLILMYQNTVSQGSIVDQVAIFSTVYRENFLCLDWYTLLFRLIHNQNDTPVYNEVQLSIFRKISLYLSSSKVKYLQPLVIDAQILESYEKESHNKKQQTTIKQIKQLQKLYVWENLTVKGLSYFKLKVILSSNIVCQEFDISSNFVLSNRFGNYSLSDQVTTKNIDISAINKFSSKLLIQNLSANFLLDDSKEEESLIINIQQQNQKFIYFYQEDENLLLNFQNQSVQFLKKKDADDVIICIDEDQIYKVSEFKLNIVDTVENFLLVAIQ